MVERYIKTVQKHLREVISMNHRDWDKRLPLFLLAYRAFTCKTTGTTPASMVFRSALQAALGGFHRQEANCD
jgi:hypothetical protein